MTLFVVSRSSGGNGGRVRKKYDTERAYLEENKKERNDREGRGRRDGEKKNAAVGGRTNKQKKQQKVTNSLQIAAGNLQLWNID